MKKILILLAILLCMGGAALYLLKPESETPEVKVPETEKVVIKMSMLTDKPGKKELKETAEILQKRLEYANVDNYTIDCTGPAELTICLPIQEDMASIRRILSTRGRMEFWPTLYNYDVYDKLPEEESLTGLLRIECSKSALIGTAHYSDTAKINSCLAQPEVRKALPKDLALMWLAKPTGDDDQRFELIAVRKNSKKAPIDNDDIEKVRAESYPYDNQVKIDMTKKGARQWEKLTTDNIHRQVAVVIDGFVYCYPTVADRIECGLAAITNNFTREEAQELAIILQHGPLPTDIQITQEEILQP